MTPTLDDGICRIFLRGFALSCSIGIHAAERAARQRVLVDIDLYTRAPAPGAPDAIGSVVDYDFLRREIGDLAASRHFDLQETLATAILDICTAPEGVLAARVATAKPDVYPDCAMIGVELFRAKPAFGIATPGAWQAGPEGR